MKAKLSGRKKLVAYLLNKDEEFKCSMESIGNLFNVSQSTISNAIKEVEHQKQIYNLNEELRNAKQLAETYKQKIIESKPKKLFKPISFEDE
ncbi:MAG: hypothetical protein ACLVE5_13880 [Clostridium perfringens]